MGIVTRIEAQVASDMQERGGAAVAGSAHQEAEERPVANPVYELSFVRRRRDGTKDFWAVEEVEDYGGACRRGEEIADEALAHMVAHDAPVLLGSIVRAMIAKGRYGGVEVGFCHRVAARSTGA